MPQPRQLLRLATNTISKARMMTASHDDVLINYSPTLGSPINARSLWLSGLELGMADSMFEEDHCKGQSRSGLDASLVSIAFTMRKTVTGDLANAYTQFCIV